MEKENRLYKLSVANCLLPVAGCPLVSLHFIQTGERCVLLQKTKNRTWCLAFFATNVPVAGEETCLRKAVLTG